MPVALARLDSDWLKQIQDAVGEIRKGLDDIGATDGDPAYGGVFKALRKIDQLAADALRRLDSGQGVSEQEYAAIAQLFGSIKGGFF